MQRLIFIITFKNGKFKIMIKKGDNMIIQDVTEYDWGSEDGGYDDSDMCHVEDENIRNNCPYYLMGLCSIEDYDICPKL